METAKDSVELSNTSQTNVNKTPYPDDVQSAWEMYLVKYPINTNSPTEMEKRKGNFVKSHAIIQEHNKNKTATFQMGHNQFSVMDDEERKVFTCGLRVPSKEDQDF